MCTVELLSRSLTRILQSYKASLGARKNRRRPLFSMLMAITLALLGWAVQCRLLVLLNFVFRRIGHDKLPHPLLFQFSNTMAGISKKSLFCSNELVPLNTILRPLGFIITQLHFYWAVPMIKSKCKEEYFRIFL